MVNIYFIFIYKLGITYYIDFYHVLYLLFIYFYLH